MRSCLLRPNVAPLPPNGRHCEPILLFIVFSRLIQMDKSLTLVLYRRTIKVVSTVSRRCGIQVALARWAEFMPSTVRFSAEDSLLSVTRRCFEVPSSPSHLSSAFAFLKESTSSTFSIELFSLWEILGSLHGYDMCESIALMSAALELTRNDSLQRANFLKSLACNYSVSLRNLVRNMNAAVEVFPEARTITTDDIDVFIQGVREASGLQRSDSKAEDFTALSITHHNQASEYVLNILLVLILRERGVKATLAGADLVYRWVRVETPGGPLFASWSQGCMRRKDVERIVRTANPQWFRARPWDTSERKSIVRALLKKQLATFGVKDGRLVNSQRSVCKEQLIHLLT